MDMLLGRHCIFLICILVVLLRQGCCSVECCEGCAICYTGIKSRRVVASTVQKYRYGRVSYRCSNLWSSSRNVCYKYRIESYQENTYKTVYCKSVGMSCRQDCECSGDL